MSGVFLLPYMTPLLTLSIVLALPRTSVVYLVTQYMDGKVAQYDTVCW